ncbi:MAG TPA: hypothetical protein VEA77_05830, partial [Hyphomicrobium sp.]|nr:hypothetical protein [Hyphomicrobium sp.]
GLAKTRSIGAALCRLGLVNEPVPKAHLDEVQGWQRAGAETYTYHFHVVSGIAVKDVLLKAVVAHSTTKSLSQLVDEWLVRRSILAAEGVRTPHLYCSAKAIFVEQFIPYGLAAYLGENGDLAPRRLADQVIHYAAVLEQLGFCPISPFHSLRTDGRDVFVIDFGADLGPPALPHGSNGLLKEATQWLESNGQIIDRSRASALYSQSAALARKETMRWM